LLHTVPLQEEVEYAYRSNRLTLLVHVVLFQSYRTLRFNQESTSTMASAAVLIPSIASKVCFIYV